jgi:hypothetical protein
MAKIQANLCRCNKCEQIFINQNAQADAEVFEVEENQYPDLQYTPDGTWVCPTCETDDYLIDLDKLTL